MAGRLASFFLVVACLLANTAMGADDAKADDAVKLDLSFRYRFEWIDDDPFDERAQASTLRSRLSLATPEVAGLSFNVEVDNVARLGSDDYNAGGGNTPHRTHFPVVADPVGTELNQAWFNIARGEFGLRLGRQRINLDNQRFVGGVGWRQNEQTFDAAKLSWTSGHWRTTYAAIDRVHRIFGADVDAGEHELNGTHLVNVSFAASDDLTLGGYYYRISNDDVAAASTTTVGLRAKGSIDRLSVEADWASQRDLDGPTSYSASYGRLDVKMEVEAVRLGVGWELLTGDERPGRAFRTPLATLHAFNGWADQFLSTPGAGLDDRYATFAWSKASWLVDARYHDFRSEVGSRGLGREFNLRVGYERSNALRTDFYFASFEGDSGRQDVTKAWLMVSASL